MMVHIVIGNSGSYDDQEAWVVCAFSDPYLAKEHCELAKRRATEILSKRKSQWDNGHDDENEFDKNMKLDPYGAYYHFESVPYFDLPKEQEDEE